MNNTDLTATNSTSPRSKGGLKRQEECLKRIQRVSADICALMKNCSSTSSSEFTLFQFALGAVFALHRFVVFDEPLVLRYLNRQRSMDLATCLTNSKEEVTELEFDSWRAGFYFNNALLRLDAICERAMRILARVPKPEDRVSYSDLLEMLSGSDSDPKKLASWSALRVLHKEVVRLKHQQGRTSRVITSGQAVTALEGVVSVCKKAATFLEASRR